MLQITPHMLIFVAIEPIDFRKGIDGICRKMLKDPFSGQIFVFRNRSKTAITILLYDGQGFWLCQKRLSKGRFKWWPKKTIQLSISWLRTNFRCLLLMAIHLDAMSHLIGSQF